MWVWSFIFFQANRSLSIDSNRLFLPLCAFASMVKYLCETLNYFSSFNFSTLLSLNNVIISEESLSLNCLSLFGPSPNLYLEVEYRLEFNSWGKAYRSSLLLFLYYNYLLWPSLKECLYRCSECFYYNGPFFISNSRLLYCVNLSKFYASFIRLFCASSFFINSDLF